MFNSNIKTVEDAFKATGRDINLPIDGLGFHYAKTEPELQDLSRAGHQYAHLQVKFTYYQLNPLVVKFLKHKIK